MMKNALIQYEHLGRIFDILSIGAIVLSLDQKIISINPSAELITGYKSSEVVGRKCRAVLFDYLDCESCQFGNVVSSGNAPVGVRIDAADNTHACSDITRIICPLADGDGRAVGCIEIFQDYSAFKDLISRVRYDHLQLKTILDNLDIGVMTVSRGEHITFFNLMAEKMTGYHRHEVLGKPFSSFFTDDPDLKKTMMDGKSHLRRESRMVTRQGRTLPVQASYMPLNNKEGKNIGGLATITDLSLMYHFRNTMEDRYTRYDMVGKDPAIGNIFEILPVIAQSDATVLVEGPTGTGKDLMAKVIHHASRRSKKPFVKVNCAAIPDNLLESEMFGYAKGAFTGAEADKPGRFQEADGGTIFLDEIGDLPQALQAKLLRVLEDREFYPLGGRNTVKVDVRIIAATNRNLDLLITEKRFREDLFYRLNVMRLQLPPLRERRGDIPLLISHILKRLCAARNSRVDKISEEAMEVLLNYDYPGNVREMENILEHALIVCRDTIIERRHLPLSIRKQAAENDSAPAAAAAPAKNDAGERQLILSALQKKGWSRGDTAVSLHMSRATLWRKMKKFNITPFLK